MLITSFHSDAPGQNAYARCAQAMEAQLRGLRLPFDIRRLPFQGGWRAMCLAKPAFLESMLDLHAQPIVWTDIDNLVHKPLPDLDPSTYDVAAPRGNDYDTGLMVLTHEVALLYVNNTPGAREFLRRWRQRCQSSREPVTDHFHLLRTWHEVKPLDGIRLLSLPGHFCTRRPAADTIVQLRKVMFNEKAVELAVTVQFHRSGGRTPPPDDA